MEKKVKNIYSEENNGITYTHVDEPMMLNIGTDLQKNDILQYIDNNLEFYKSVVECIYSAPLSSEDKMQYKSIKNKSIDTTINKICLKKIWKQYKIQP